jgi:hypothetical protein
VASFEIAPGVHPGVNGPMLFFTHDLPGVPDLTAPRDVICRITNLSTIVAQASLQARYCASRLPVRSLAIPAATLNHAYQLILEALTPKVEIVGSQISIEFGQELQGFSPLAQSQTCHLAIPARRRALGR